MHSVEVVAPSSWTCIDFISDLHLQVNEPGTVSALAAYLAATPASALFILGDLFEVWVGDDCLDADAARHLSPPHLRPLPAVFANACAALLQTTGHRIPLYIMVGNRDFLMGERLMQACSAQAIPDPTILTFAGERWLLTHGDALCTADIPYQRFREQVRNPDWQQNFLAKPLAERLAIAADLRARSEMTKQQTPATIDLDTTASLEWLDKHHAQHMLHGHTHRPAVHALSEQHNRAVLSDWDTTGEPPRADALRLSVGPTGQPVMQRVPVLASI